MVVGKTMLSFVKGGVAVGHESKKGLKIHSVGVHKAPLKSKPVVRTKLNAGAVKMTDTSVNAKHATIAGVGAAGYFATKPRAQNKHPQVRGY